MKHDLSVSNILSISTKRNPQKTQVFVLAVAPSAKKDGYAVRKEFAKEFKPVLDRVSAAKELSTKSGAMTYLRFSNVRGADHFLVVGTGLDKSGINALGSAERLRRLGAQVASKLTSEKAKSATVALDSFLAPESKIALDPATAAYAFAEGFGLALYKFDKYISKSDQSKKTAAFELVLTTGLESRAKAFVEGTKRALAMLEGSFICRDLGNEPSNELIPAEYAERAKKLAQAHGLKCTVLDEKELAKEKMGLLLGVGQGSVNAPRLFVLEYNPPKSKKAKTIAFVGKGITFDSGGISIKPSAKMEDMKHDMCGSAAVVGAVVAAAELKLPVRIIAVVAAAENMPGGRAIQPGNILKSRAGKTVEITNTDAEGRLILADALDYIQDKNPDYIIDLATLTGAAGITLGKLAAGLMGNNDAFNRAIAKAASLSGERVWELPLYDEYFDDLKSEYADMRNSGDTPYHGTAKGAMFLKEFIRKGVKWAHLDIASVAYSTGFIPYNPKKASSGYGVRLLIELAKGLK